MQDATRKRAIWVVILLTGLVSGVALSAIGPAHDSPQAAGAPQPIAEIVVVPVSAPSRQIFIYTASPDAENWVRDNAGKYGTLHTPEETGMRYFSLFVDDTYRRVEVIDYIQTMGTGFLRFPKGRMPNIEHVPETDIWDASGKAADEPIWIEPTQH